MQPDFLDTYDPPEQRIGFTGTRVGLSAAQCETLDRFLRASDVANTLGFHHGDCIGADADFDAIVRAIHDRPPMEIHPCQFADMRAHCERRGPTTVHAPRRHDRRNLEIVKRTATLLVGPDGFAERQQSGTWQTYRMGRREGRRVLVIWPDGQLEDRSLVSSSGTKKEHEI